MKEQSQQNNNKGRVGYGVKIPILKFEEVIELIKIIYNKAGENNSIDALSSITGNSSSSSTFNKKLAAFRNYGVLNIDKIGYSLTELGIKIAKPESFDEQHEAIIQSFLNQENLRKIWESFKGKKLPQEEYLENSIQKIISIPAELKKDWAEYFVEAGRYAGLLEERETGSYQVLQGYIKSLNNNSIRTQDEVKVRESINIQIEDPKLTQSKIEKNIPLTENFGINTTKNISENRKAYFMIPDQLTQQDIESLRVVIKGIELQLDGLKKFDYDENAN